MKHTITTILSLTLLAGGALAQQDKPTDLSWGQARVHITPRPEKDYSASATATISLNGKVVKTVKDWDISASLKPLKPGGLSELVLETFSGGAHCCSTYYGFSQDAGKVQNLFILDAGNYGANFQDLNRDGTDEIVYGNDAFAYYDYSFATSPTVNYVLGWDGVRIADLTRRYAYVPAQEAARNLQTLLHPDATADGDASLQFDDEKARLVGFYVNSIVAGQGVQAENTLNTQVFSKYPALKPWYAAHRSELLSTLYAAPGAGLSISDANSLPVKTQQP